LHLVVLDASTPSHISEMTRKIRIPTPTGSNDAASNDATSNDATSNDATSNDATSNDATSNDPTSNDPTSASNDAASNDAASNDAASNDAASNAAASNDAASNAAASNAAASNDPASNAAASNNPASNDADSDSDSDSDFTVAPEVDNQAYSSRKPSVDAGRNHQGGTRKKLVGFPGKLTREQRAKELAKSEVKLEEWKRAFRRSKLTVNTKVAQNWRGRKGSNT
jgi:hypothetical protein